MSAKNSFKVHMLAFAKEDTVRTVEIPEDKMEADVETTLDLIFEYGQNDFQPKRCPSVSMGDVIELHDGSFHLVVAVGFKKISPDELATYRSMPRRDRLFFEPKGA